MEKKGGAEGAQGEDGAGGAVAGAGRSARDTPATAHSICVAAVGSTPQETLSLIIILKRCGCGRQAGGRAARSRRRLGRRVRAVPDTHLISFRRGVERPDLIRRDVHGVVRFVEVPGALYAGGGAGGEEKAKAIHGSPTGRSLALRAVPRINIKAGVAGSASLETAGSRVYERQTDPRRGDSRRRPVKDSGLFVLGRRG